MCCRLCRGITAGVMRRTYVEWASETSCGGYLLAFKHKAECAAGSNSTVLEGWFRKLMDIIETSNKIHFLVFHFHHKHYDAKLLTSAYIKLPAGLGSSLFFNTTNNQSETHDRTLRRGFLALSWALKAVTQQWLYLHIIMQVQLIKTAGCPLFLKTKCCVHAHFMYFTNTNGSKKKGKFIFFLFRLKVAILLTCGVGGSSKAKSGPWCSGSCGGRPKATKRAWETKQITTWWDEGGDTKRGGR